MKKGVVKSVFFLIAGIAASASAFSATFSPLNIPVSATGQIVFTISSNPGGFNGSFACNVALSGNVNAFGNVIVTSGSLSGASGCASIRVGVHSSTATPTDFSPISSSQVGVDVLFIDEPIPLGPINFECEGHATVGWNNATSQVIFSNTPFTVAIPCQLSGALTFTPAIKIQ